MKEGLKRFFATYNETWTMKTWAVLALLIFSIVCFSVGVTELFLSYSGEIAHPEIVGGWIVTALGAGLYCVSYFGIKAPKDLRKEAKKEDQK